MIRLPPTSTLFPYTTLFLFFFNDTATTEIYTLSLHDALPISCVTMISVMPSAASCLTTASTSLTSSGSRAEVISSHSSTLGCMASARAIATRCCWPPLSWSRSEEHTSELQSHSDLVCRLLLEK